MNDNLNTESLDPIKAKTIPWKIIAIILSMILVVCLVISYLIIGNNNNVLNSWKTLYEEENLTRVNQDLTQKLSIQEYESTIVKLTDDKNKLKEDLSKYYNDLTKEQEITSKLLCDKQLWDFTDVNFSYSGNTAMSRELKKFVENNLKENEKITGESWDTIYNNVDIAMHKITFTGNFRYNFITSFLDKDFPVLKNSIYWINKGCFLDFHTS